MRLLPVLLLLAAAAAAAPARAQNAGGGQRAIVCPAAMEDPAPPDFAAPACETVPLARVDPQGRLIWVRTELPVSGALLETGAPLGVFVSAKASSQAWLNGAFVGANGTPAAARADERPGRMDAVFPAPRELLQSGAATLDLRMSSHRGLLRLAGPVHGAGVDLYQPPQYGRLKYYWPSLVTFGALLAGGLYFAAGAMGAEGRRDSLLLSAMSLFAAAQLFAEAARGLFAYPYPAHDLRVLAIYLCALGFGLALAAHVVLRFEDRRPRALLAAIAALAVAISVPASGFDSKTVTAILAPAALCATLAAIWTLRRRPGARQYLAALLVFVTMIAVAPVVFVDVIFYYAVAALLLFLFVQQALALSEERRLRRREAERASRLELVLQQREESANAAITVSSAGRTERMPVSDIAFIRGAGDYVELCLTDGREILHADSLNALEESLPATFVRVHRSHIVNTACVQTLEREVTGVGRLRLTNGAEVPVSRRILPKVRAALA